MTPFEQALIAFVGEAAMEAAAAHARAEYPKESCGFVAGGQYIACENKAEDPKQTFVINDPRYDAAFAGGKITCIVHSHPDGPICPSQSDMQQQIATDVPWVILIASEKGVSHYIGWGDALPRAALIGRPFVHGIFDCYSLIRDTFGLGKDELEKIGVGWPLAPIKLPEIPRDNNWWEKGDDLYEKNFAPQGFKIITRTEARPGDGFLMRLGDISVNPKQQLTHAGLLLEKEMVLHHLPARASRREPAGLWARAADLWVRYEGKGA